MNVQEKYLLNYAEPEAAFVASYPTTKNYTQCVVIPAYKEKHTFLERFFQTRFEKCVSNKDQTPNILLILVLNCPDSDTANTNSEEAVHQYIGNHGKSFYSHKNIEAIQVNESRENIDILIINRYDGHLKLPIKQGVGLARKIGCDIAISLANKNILKSNIIYSTDADAQLPDNYFSSSKNIPSNYSALVFDFKHSKPNTCYGEATQLYELAIKYFRDQLIWANSPYGFNTLGSTLAISVNHYCQVRGFPKRAAAEDFYLLNKLAKVGEVKYLPEIKINIESRLSDRVPFGTGPAVKEICRKLENGENYLYYHPLCFTHLKETLQTILSGATCSQLSPQSQEALNVLGFEKFLIHAKAHCKNNQQYTKAFHDWFDGFRTLKFIRHLQHHHYKAIPLNECLKQGKS